MQEYVFLTKDFDSIPQFKSKEQIVIRRITGDLHTFCNVWNTIVSSGSIEDFSDFPKITVQYFKEKLQKEPKLDSGDWFIALYQDEPCGLITVTKNGELGDLMVSKQHQRLGVGTTLVIEALKFLKNEGVNKATLKVRKSNSEALRFYSSLDFHVKGREVILAGY